MKPYNTDPTTGKITYVKQSDMLKCPFAIMVPEHYRPDGSCMCDDPEHRKVMVDEWGYIEFEILEALDYQDRSSR